MRRVFDNFINVYNITLQDLFVFDKFYMAPTQTQDWANKIKEVFDNICWRYNGSYESYN